MKVSLLNFFVTAEGLEEQLLGTVVTNERPDLANMKNQLVVSNAKMKKELKDIEDKILFMLSNSQVCFLAGCKPCVLHTQQRCLSSTRWQCEQRAAKCRATSWTTKSSSIRSPSPR